MVFLFSALIKSWKVLESKLVKIKYTYTYNISYIGIQFELGTGI